MIKLHATALRMMPIPDSVLLPFFAKKLEAEGSFNPPEIQHKTAEAMSTELKRWTDALQVLR